MELVLRKQNLRMLFSRVTPQRSSLEIQIDGYRLSYLAICRPLQSSTVAQTKIPNPANAGNRCRKAR